MISPKDITQWRYWTVDESPRTTTSMNAPDARRGRERVQVVERRRRPERPTMPVRSGTISAAKIAPIR